MPNDWLGAPLHDSWLRGEELRLLRFARRVVRDDGMAGWLGEDGTPDFERPAATYVAARMAHSFYLGGIRGVPGCDILARRLMVGLRDTARDARNGGWFEQVPAAADDRKAAYTHAFVILAASTGTFAGDEVARGVLADALAVVDEHFWEPTVGRFADGANRDWSVREEYRGINSNMHLVEAMFAATDATGDAQWAERALKVCDFVIARASGNLWRIPEHYDADWQPLLEYNREIPTDQFKPYGATVGHAFEWARLIAQAAPHSREQLAYLEAAHALASNAAEDGWARDGHPGFVYTTDWKGEPVVSDRLHWVTCEAIAAAAVLAEGDETSFWGDRYRAWWDYAATYVLDFEKGSWHHQLDASNQPSSTVWSGKPDLYHALQAVLISQLPSSTSVAKAACEIGMRAGHLSL